MESFVREYLSPDYGLINSNKNVPHSEENSSLWSVQYCLKFRRPPMIIRENLRRYIADCKRLTPGRYDQLPKPASNPKDDYMSPDQLIAFVSHFYLLGNMVEINLIWKFLKSRWFTYDNITGETNFKRLMQPMAIAFVGACAGSKFWKFVLSIACIVSCLAPREKTSGKLKAWTCLRTLKMNITYKLCEELTDFDEAFQIYFNTHGNRSDHPNLRREYNEQSMDRR